MSYPKVPRGRRSATPEQVVAAQEELNRAMKEQDPACLDDPRFTASRPRPLRGHERKELYLTCFECPIFEACAKYAQVTRPAAGFWAGKNYGTWERKS